MGFLTQSNDCTNSDFVAMWGFCKESARKLNLTVRYSSHLHEVKFMNGSCGNKMADLATPPLAEMSQVCGALSSRRQQPPWMAVTYTRATPLTKRPLWRGEEITSLGWGQSYCIKSAGKCSRSSLHTWYQLQLNVRYHRN